MTLETNLDYVYTETVFLKTVTFLCVCTFRLHINGENAIENVFVWKLQFFQSENIRKRDE